MVYALRDVSCVKTNSTVEQESALLVTRASARATSIPLGTRLGSRNVGNVGTATFNGLLVMLLIIMDSLSLSSYSLVAFLINLEPLLYCHIINPFNPSSLQATLKLPLIASNTYFSVRFLAHTDFSDVKHIQPNFHCGTKY